MNRLVKTMLRCLFTVMFLVANSYLHAQVTVGDATAPKSFSVLEVSSRTTKGGLRLPHLTTAERKALNTSNAQFMSEMGRDIPNPGSGTHPGLALGLTIYNTDTNCIEYWDGYKWVSLCLGTADIQLKENCGGTINYYNADTPPLAEADGTPLGCTYTPEETPVCSNNPPYTVSVVVGAAYAEASIIEQSTGEFNVSMQPNATARERTAVVRVMNNCTGEYNEFLFAQKGNIDLCNNLPAKPILTASNGGVICGSVGNSIILAVTNPHASATYIWMRNDNEEIGRGKFIVVSQAGNYKVYAGGIGCTGNDVSAPIAVTVSTSGTSFNAPTITANNGAIICGGTPVTLTITDFSSITGTVQWYKDGLLQPTQGTGQSFTVYKDDAGTYMAVVQNGTTCASSPSNAITIEEKSGTPIIFKESDIEINGVTYNGIPPTLCSGGWLNMRIKNVMTGYTYKWVVNGTQIGAGTTCNYQLPGSANTDVNLSIIAESGTAGSCASAVTISSTISVNEPLNAAIIGAKIFCNNVPGGAQLNTTPGGATYVWKNLTTGTTNNTGAVNSLGANTSGKYQVAITTTAGCLSITPVPHEVEMIGSPALTWTGGVLASVVGAGETVTFVVKNVGSPVTQGYKWTATNKTGSANASFPMGATTDVTQIKFAGNGIVTLTIVGEGFCGSSAPLTVDITVNADKPDKPIIVTPPATAVCGGWLFKIEEGTPTTPGTIKYYEAQYGTNFTITWNEEVTSTFGVGTKIVSGANNRYCYFPFTVSSSQVTMVATCTSQGLVSDPSDAKTVTGGLGTPQSYTLKGQTCFDIKQTKYPDTDCGIWEQRTEAKFENSYTYQLDGTLVPTNASALTWSLDDPNNLVQSTNFTQVNEASLKMNNAKLNANIIGNKTGLSFTLHVTFTVMNASSCNATYTQSIVVNIKDCDCCGNVTDVDGNTYKAASFGPAGCWMIENLATTRNPDGYTLPYAIPNGIASIARTKPAASGGESWGLQYTWTTVVIGAIPSDIVEAGMPGTAKSTLQGICPDGWIVPSDYDWSMLEKEIATNPKPYSSNPKIWVWNPAWQSSTTWRPSNSNIDGGWGESMKIPGTVGNGLSNTDGTGFEMKPVGNNQGMLQYTYYWTSSAYMNQESPLNRAFDTKTAGVMRSHISKANKYVVRCKKIN